MKRRDLLGSSLVCSAAILTGVVPVSAQAQAPGPAAAPPKHRFRLKYAPHFGMFQAHAGADLLDQLKFAADEGFPAFEDNGMRGRPTDVQERLTSEMTRLGLAMGVFVANDRGLELPILTSGDQSMLAEFLANIRESVAVAQRVNAKWATLVVGKTLHRMQEGYQTAHVIEALKRAAEICEPSGLALVAEPLNVFRDHPEFFVRSNHQMYALIKAVRSPSCKMLFDVYHTQVNEGNILPNMDRCWDEIAYIQTGDHPGRREPTTGEINYLNVFKHIHSKDYTGIVGMEHGKSKPGREGERAVIDAYIACDSF